MITYQTLVPAAAHVATTGPDRRPLGISPMRVDNLARGAGAFWYKRSAGRVNAVMPSSALITAQLSNASPLGTNIPGRYGTLWALDANLNAGRTMRNTRTTEISGAIHAVTRGAGK